MQLELIRQIQAQNPISFELPVGNFQSLVIEGIDNKTESGDNISNSIKIISSKYGARYDIPLADLFEPDNYLYGRIIHTINTNGTDLHTYQLRIPFDLPEVKNALAIMNENEYTFQYNQGVVEDGDIRIYVEKTYHPMIKVPYWLPFHINGSGLSTVNIQKPNVARIFSFPDSNNMSALTDDVYICKNNSQVVYANNGNLILSACIDGRIEEDDTTLLSWMVNTIPSQMEEELHNHCKVSVNLSAQGTQRVYAFGFEDIDKASGCTNSGQPNWLPMI